MVDITDIWPESVKLLHAAYVKRIIDSQEAEKIPWGLKSISDFVGRHPLAFSVGDVASILAAMADFEKCCTNNGSKWKNRALRKFESVFSYKKFSDKKSNDWCAYELCRRAKYYICPYCQQSYAMTIHRADRTRALRPTLDHYYPKSRFPFLAISLFNLVPSCYTCNSSLKGARDFYKDRHLHPYVASSGIGFKLDMAAYAAGKSTGDGRWRAIVDLAGGSLADRNTVKTFAIAERYQFIENEVARFAESAYQFYCIGPTRYIEIARAAGVEPSDIISLGFDELSYKNELLGRLKRDLLVEIRTAVERGAFNGGNVPAD